jgi:uncharacterized protein YciI
MTAYLFQSEYTASLAEVDDVRAGHVEWLKERARAGGPVIVGRRQTPRVIVMLAGSRAEIAATLANDAYVLRDVARYDIVTFEPGGIP